MQRLGYRYETHLVWSLSSDSFRALFVSQSFASWSSVRSGEWTVNRKLKVGNGESRKKVYLGYSNSTFKHEKLQYGDCSFNTVVTKEDYSIWRSPRDRSLTPIACPPHSESIDAISCIVRTTLLWPTSGLGFLGQNRWSLRNAYLSLHHPFNNWLGLRKYCKFHSSWRRYPDWHKLAAWRNAVLHSCFSSCHTAWKVLGGVVPLAFL